MPPEESFVARMGQGVFYMVARPRKSPAFGKPDRELKKLLILQASWTVWSLKPWHFHPIFSTKIKLWLAFIVDLGSCPTYLETGNENDSPRGNMRSIENGRLSLNGSHSPVSHIDRCLGCRACETACPSGVLTASCWKRPAITSSVMPGAPVAGIEKIFPFPPVFVGPHCQQWRSSEWISRRFCPDS